MDIDTQQALVERECEVFREQLEQLVDPDWPVDVRVVVRYFHEHLFDPGLQVGKACRACGVYDGRFRRVFKHHCRQTMHGYCEDKRLLATVRLLGFSGLEIGSIAFGIGYENYRTFGRAFKRRFGQTPGAFREVMAQHPEAAPTSTSVDASLHGLKEQYAPK